MRTLLVLLVAGVALAGCATKNPTDNGGGNTTTTPGGTGSNMTMTTPVATDNHDFSACAVPAGTPLPTSCPSSKAITVPAAVTMLNLTVEWSPSQGAPATPIGPDGMTVKLGSVSCSVSGPGAFQGAPKCTKNVAATGITKIEYAGAGGASAKVTVTGG